MSAGEGIPQILHFCWKTNEVPGRMGNHLARWRALHADWDVRLWTDATMREFVAQDYPELLRLYDGYEEPIQRADAFRYLVLHRLGGVYADLEIAPLRAIDGLIAGQGCIVGLEPYEHIGPDLRHSGVPYLLSNAFMGAGAGNPYIAAILDLLPRLADIPDVFFSTGRAVTTGAAVRLPKADRPVLVPARLWAPKCVDGKPCATDAYLARMLGEAFDFVRPERKAFVSNHWLMSGARFASRNKLLAAPFRALGDAQWRARAFRHPELAASPLPDAEPYHDQTPKPPERDPGVTVCVMLRDGEALSPTLAAALQALDYPRDRLAFELGAFVQEDGEQAAVGASMEALRAAGIKDASVRYVPRPIAEARGRPQPAPANEPMAWSARMRNQLIDAVGAEREWTLFIGGEAGDVPPDALRQALSAGYPVVALGMRAPSGEDLDLSTHRYARGGGIRVMFDVVGPDGVATAARGQRVYPGVQRAFRLVPLDGVGRGFVLVNRDVLKAGVRFAETPLHLHLDGEAFAIDARLHGFEVAALTELAVSPR